MVKKVVGVYDTETEAIEAINNLKVAGITPEEISILARSDKEINWIQHETNIEATTSADWIDPDARHEEDESFWEKVKNFFAVESDTYDEGEGYFSRFTHHGLTDVEAERYNAEVERGKIVVLAPEGYTDNLNTNTSVNNFMTDTEINAEHKMKLREEELEMNLNNMDESRSHSRELDAAYLEDEDQELALRRAKKNRLNKDNDDFL